MENFINVFVFIARFIVIALSSKQIGQFFRRFKLPLITGFLFTGIVAGPFGLKLITHEAVENLRVIDEISLAFIAFAAGSELYVQELRGRLKSIAWITLGLVILTFSLSAAAIFFFLSRYIPFMQNMSPAASFAVALLIGAILVARSPSSAIAILNELRAKGPFTKTVLGVTVIMDVVVIFLFAFTTSMADVLIANLGFDLKFALLLLGEFALSLGVGYLLGKLLHFVLSWSLNRRWKVLTILAIGLGVFVFSEQLRHLTHEFLSFEIFLEPILLCMIASFVVTNTSRYRTEFSKIIHETGPLIYIIFFTLTGASLELDVLMQTWPIALALFFVRLAGIFVGSFAGGVLAREPMARNKMWWMGFVTQAGVAIGLSKEVAVEFPPWGSALATMIISLVVLNEIVGPIFFKYAINLIGEAHDRADPHEFRGTRNAVIFGLRPQAVSLARQLMAHDWQVKMVCREPSELEGVDKPELTIELMPEVTVACLDAIQMSEADAIVTMLSDEENYAICELVYETYGTDTIVTRLKDRANFDRFHELGVLVVEPRTAVVSLLDHFVRAPAGTSLLLGMQEEQDIVDIELRNSDLDGISLRDLRLPLDVLILSVQRNGERIISHGYTKLTVGDKVTMVGNVETLEEVMLHFDA
ncbi:MAG: potassium transporter TrkA [Chloroflexi bacterium]|nr:MAG: potassium transporter TrkA [Chloroflexota bacterium]